jgi:hypothetical protein
MATKQPPRKEIPPDIQKAVLTKSRRRCALCFYYDKDTSRKNGQIAHLDRRRSNNHEDNLAWLCLNHHSEYDSRTSQHKNFTVEEVKHARKALFRWVREGLQPIAVVTKSPKRTGPAATSIVTLRGFPSKLPGKRPMVAPSAYEKAPDRHEGLKVSNDGIPAFDVQVEPIMLNDGWSVTFDDINRLEKDAFLRSFVSRANESILSLWGLWHHNQSQPAIVPLIIKYRDFGGRWYRSVCELHRDVMKQSGFDVRFIRQE